MIGDRLVLNLLGGERLGNLLIGGIDGRRFRCDDHSLRHSGRFENEIDYSRLIKSYFDRFLRLCEALL